MSISQISSPNLTEKNSDEKYSGNIISTSKFLYSKDIDLQVKLKMYFLLLFQFN